MPLVKRKISFIKTYHIYNAGGQEIDKAHVVL